MTARNALCALAHVAMALTLCSLHPRGASAAFDMSGKWLVVVPFPPATEHWDVVQTGTSIPAMATADPPNSYSYTFSGTIDPAAGIADIGCLITIAANRKTFSGCPFEICLPQFIPGCNPLLSCCPLEFQYEGSRYLCGNGVVDPGEECDDGNSVDGDGCDTNCTFTACGNGITTAGEPCDDGDAIDTNACKSDCTPNDCGDGAVQLGVEQCDDGNATDGDGCDSNCTLTGCGNGIVTNGEECDDGNSIEGDGCDSNCTLTACGNRIRTAGEACDDGNAVNGD